MTKFLMSQYPRILYPLLDYTSETKYGIWKRIRSSGFRRFFTEAFDRLFKVRLFQVTVNDCRAGLGN